MLKLGRVCIPVGLKCNLHCKYCFRTMSKVKDIPLDLSVDMKKYLMQLNPAITESVIISGGEPLLYLKSIKEVFSFASKNVHKCIMSNCTLLTQDIVDYLNQNNIELHLSHDGKATKYLRGVDVLENEKIRNLIKQVNTLMVFSVVTNKNCNIVENYLDTTSRLGRDDIIYKTNAVYDTGFNQDLIKDFNYDLFYRSFAEFCNNYAVFSPYYDNYYKDKGVNTRRGGFNVDLHGNVRSMNYLTIYGNIYNTYEELEAAREKTEDVLYCNNHDCGFKDRCRTMKSLASEHFCRCAQITEEVYHG